MSAEPCATVDAVSRKHLHDLRAPLITMRGFGSELADAVARLAELVDEHQRARPDEFLARTRDVLERDVGPSLSHLQSSVERLGNVLDELSAAFSEVSGR